MVLATKRIPRGAEIHFANAWKQALAYSKALRCVPLGAKAAAELRGKVMAQDITVNLAEEIIRVAVLAAGMSPSIGCDLAKFYRILSPPDTSHAEALRKPDTLGTYPRPTRTSWRA
eukprot:548557-Amphidinium_carterae.1